MLGDGSLKRIRKQPFITETPRRPRYLDGAMNLDGEVTWATWFELPASRLDEITPGKYTWITAEAKPPKNLVSRKPSDFSQAEMQLRSMNTRWDTQMLTGIAGRLRADGTRTVRLLG